MSEFAEPTRWPYADFVVMPRIWGRYASCAGELAPPPHAEPEGAPPEIRAVYFGNGGIMVLNKSGFYPQPERHDGVLSAIIAGFVAGVTATITMLKLVR